MFAVLIIYFAHALQEDCQPFGLRLFLGHYYSSLYNEADALRVVFNTNNECLQEFVLNISYNITYYETQLLNMTQIYEGTKANITYQTYIHTFKIAKQNTQQVSYKLYHNNELLASQTIRLPFLKQDTTKVLFFGDMDSSWVMNRSKATFDWLQEQVSQSAQYDSILFTGDMAYDLESDNCMRGEFWLRNISTFTKQFPFMVTPGNHDGGYNYKYQFLRAHFQMLYLSNYDTPNYQNDFYSFNIGLIHFITYDPVMLVYKADPQNLNRDRILAQFRHDLEQVNREHTPWVVVFTHYPIYCNYMDDDQCVNNFHYLAEFESLFQEFSVDLYVSGHQHNYQRNTPYYQNHTVKYTLDNNVFSDYESPVTIIEGAGGADYGPEMMVYKDQPYTLKQLAGNGVGVLECVNRTHLHYQHISATNNTVVDEIWIVHQGTSGSTNTWFVVSMVLLGILLIIVVLGGAIYYRFKRYQYIKSVDQNIV